MAHPTDEHFLEIFESYKQDVFRVAYSYLKRSEDAEDVVQDVFLDYYQKPPKEESNLKAYLVVAAVHRSLNKLKKQRREREVLLKVAKESPQSTLPPSTEERIDVENALLTLSAGDQEILRLYYYGHLTVEEISLAYHIQPEAAKKRLYRAKEKLKEKLSEK